MRPYYLGCGGIWEGYPKIHMTGSHPSPTTLFAPSVLQDRYALQSYQRAANAWQRGAFDLEVAPVRVKNPRATPKLGMGKLE